MKNKKVYIIISIDTECDKDPKWEIPQPMSFENIKIQKDIFGELYSKYNIKPTYLLSPEILKNDECIKIFKEFQNIELGTHLHEEFIEPNSNVMANRTKNIQADLSPEIEKAKLTQLTELFTHKFGYSPKSFRAGRFGSSPRSYKVLEELGYLVDSSITPFKTNYFDSGFVSNGWGKPLEPYFCTKNKKILQVPVTIINRDFNNIPSFILNKMESKKTSILKKFFTKLGFKSKSEWLRPYRKNSDEMKNISEFVLKNKFKKDDFAILNIMFHSNEILPNASPYCKNNKEVNNFVNSLDQLFNHLTQKYQLCFIGLGDVYELYSRN